MYQIALEYHEHAQYVHKYEPAHSYPEYPWKKTAKLSESNDVYNMVRNCLLELGLDREHAGTEAWNPFSALIQPGNTVVIKPNLVLHKNYRKGHEDDVECVFTNPCVVAPVIDYVVIALKGKGKIIVGDAPVQECDFDALLKKSGYGRLIKAYQARGVDIVIKDFRGVVSVSDYGVLRQSVIPDAEYKIVKLNEHSEFSGVEEQQLKRLRITNYDPKELLLHHNAEVQEYCVAAAVLNADCIINMPKPKTHKKAGITACLKNLVGINCRKEYLPHHTTGSAMDGGDEYYSRSKLKETMTKTHDSFCKCVSQKRYLSARFFQAKQIFLELYMKKLSSDHTSFGSWKGNHTISRTTIDLNRILIYADKNGVIREEAQRKLFNIADMIISGQHNGPMAPESRPIGIIMAGENSFAMDLVIAKLMRAKIDKIPTLQLCKEKEDLPIFDRNSEITLSSHDERWNHATLDDFNDQNSFFFKAPDDWEECFDRPSR